MEAAKRKGVGLFELEVLPKDREIREIRERKEKKKRGKERKGKEIL